MHPLSLQVLLGSGASISFLSLSVGLLTCCLNRSWQICPFRWISLQCYLAWHHQELYWQKGYFPPTGLEWKQTGTFVVSVLLCTQDFFILLAPRTRTPSPSRSPWVGTSAPSLTGPRSQRISPPLHEGLPPPDYRVGVGFLNLQAIVLPHLQELRPTSWLCPATK